jgi:hypothetical protein
MKTIMKSKLKHFSLLTLAVAALASGLVTSPMAGSVAHASGTYTTLSKDYTPPPTPLSTMIIGRLKSGTLGLPIDGASVYLYDYSTRQYLEVVTTHSEGFFWLHTRLWRGQTYFVGVYDHSRGRWIASKNVSIPPGDGPYRHSMLSILLTTR